MGMAAILFSGTEPFEQIINTHSTEGPTRHYLIDLYKYYSNDSFGVKNGPATGVTCFT